MKCIICEKEFEKNRKHKRMAKKNNVTCSRKCSVIYARIHRYLWKKIRNKLKEEDLK